jgi:hypothetical protein
MKFKNSRLTPSTNAPSFNTCSYTNWFAGTAIPSTTVTATPRPNAVETFLETARKVHIPKKKESAMFSMKIAFTNRLI